MINIRGNKKVLVDSDGLIGLIHKNDALHNRCLTVGKYLFSNSCATIVPYPIVLEAATTLAKDKTINRPDLAHQLLKDYQTTEETELQTTNVFSLLAKLYQPKTSRKNSPFDYYLLALAQKNNINLIFSFDAFYKKQGLVLIEDFINTRH